MDIVWAFFSFHFFFCHVLSSVSASLKENKAWAVLVGFITRPKTMFYIEQVKCKTLVILVMEQIV